MDLQNETYDFSNRSSIHRLEKSYSLTNVAFNNTLLALCACGSVGNVLSFVALIKSRQSTTTLWLKILSITDLLFLLALATDIITITYGFALYFSIFAPVVLGGTGLMSIWIVVFVSLERYIAVVHPFKVRFMCTTFRVKVILGVLIVLSPVLHIPLIFEYKIIEYTDEESGLTARTFATTPFFNSIVYQVAYKMAFMFIIRLIIPLFLMIYSSVSIIQALRRSRSFVSRSSGAVGGASAGNREASVMVVSVVIVLVVCQLPTLLYYTCDALNKLTPSFYHDNNLIEIHYTLFFMMLVAITCNSSVNFLIYVVASKCFRVTLHAMFTCSTKKQRPNSASEVSAISDDNVCERRL